MCKGFSQGQRKLSLITSGSYLPGVREADFDSVYRGRWQSKAPLLCYSLWESLSQQEHTHFITMLWSSQGAISVEFTLIHWISFPSGAVFCRIKVNLCVFLLSASLKSLPQWVWIQSRDLSAVISCRINQNWCFKLSHSKSTLYSKECIKQKNHCIQHHKHL